jgi:hypothetical protein
MEQTVTRAAVRGVPNKVVVQISWIYFSNIIIHETKKEPEKRNWGQSVMVLLQRIVRLHFFFNKDKETLPALVLDLFTFTSKVITSFKIELKNISMWKKKKKVEKEKYYWEEGSKLGPLDNKVHALPSELWRRRCLHVAIQCPYSDLHYKSRN